MTRGHSIQHYATKADYELVLSDVQHLRLKYVLNESRVDQNFRIYQSPLDMPDFGVSRWATGSSVRFVVLPHDMDPPFDFMPNREVPEKYGFFSPKEGYSHIYFECSAIYRFPEGGDGLLEGWISTNSTNEKSLEIFAAFKKAIRKHFEKIKVCYVGPEAAAYLDGGGRLNSSLTRPEAYDLRR